jgi:hypothetical protein
MCQGCVPVLFDLVVESAFVFGEHPKEPFGQAGHFRVAATFVFRKWAAICDNHSGVKAHKENSPPGASIMQIVLKDVAGNLPSLLEIDVRHENTVELQELPSNFRRFPFLLASVIHGLVPAILADTQTAPSSLPRPSGGAFSSNDISDPNLTPFVDTALTWTSGRVLLDFDLLIKLLK